MIGRRHLLVWLIASLAVCDPAIPSPAASDEGCDACNRDARCGAPAVRPQDAIWAISTRHMGSACCSKPCGDIRLMRYEGCQRWSPADVGEFYATDDPAAITIIYVHAARVDQEDVTPRAMALYRNLVAGAECVPPLRLVVWCWPADKTPRPLDDFRRMAVRSDSDACYLGRFLSGIRSEVKVSLIGYSMGARIITGALHLLGGGQVCCCRLAVESSSPSSVRVRVVLWAPAVHSDWLYPRRPFEKAVLPLDGMLVLYNPCDPVLARYALLEECYRPWALGYVGIRAPERLGDARTRVTAKNVACLVGSRHQFTAYLSAPWVMENTSRWALWQMIGEADLSPPRAP